MDDLARTHLRTVTREIARRRDSLTSCGIDDADIRRKVRLLDRIVVTAGNGTVSVRIDAHLTPRDAHAADGVLTWILDVVEGTVRERAPLNYELTY